ncbi:MAG: DNA polymerase III subunit chi [Bdellovibrionales bacterium]|jgi:DNA polymerase-3 subunit chi|nr:DNA polymerase III subunit chi [Bdellovibrionales bacterium]
MTDIRFYHMITKRLEQALPELLAKAITVQPRVVVKAGSRERIETLDSLLWTYDSASFLPHGYARDGFEADQPVWLTTEDDNPNQAKMLILTDGAVSDHVAEYELCCELFDGNDADAVAAARRRWTAYKAAGHDLTYFQQDEQGRWVKK